MGNLNKNKILLGKYSIILFIFTTFGLLGSVIFHNTISSFNYSSHFPYSNSTISEIKCNKKNNFCKDILIPEKTASLGLCTKQHYRIKVYFNNEQFSGLYEKYIDLLSKDKIKNFNNQKIMIKPYIFKNLDERCIKNYAIYKAYKFFPYPFEKIHELKRSDAYISPTGQNTINPFLYGESSISNIVKHYPINYFFKSVMILVSIFLFLYWRGFNNIFIKLKTIQKIQLFYFFGIISSIALLFHVLFLGVDFESKLSNQIRSSFIVFFIIFKILAQSFLVYKLNNNKNILNNIFDEKVIKFKILYLAVLAIGSIYILLIINDLHGKVENLYEWNFFFFLSFFYFLSYLMIKKSNCNPSTS